MARISVVVPIYDVEAYLPDCLRSLAAQTIRDLEVVMVDDGSTDGSAAIAARFAASDRRFRLIAQANAGLGHARNTGAAAANGELLAFVDSDDVVPGDAYELLAGSLDQSGSDFASGNVLRLSGEQVSQSPFLAATFARTRLRTHVTRFRPLLADRIACNKLWRRSFWDDHDLRFPEGVLHEDIPVTLPAHVMAEAVDVLAEPVYHWRVRRDGDRSITQRRLELRALVDRLAAVEHVRAYIAEHGSRRLRRWYDERLVRDELRLYLDLLADADERYRAVFIERAGARFERRRPRRGRTDELVEVLRFAQERQAQTPPLRRRGRWYGDYPFRGERELAVPRSVYRLGKPDAELALRATIEELRGDDGGLVVRGHVHLGGLAVPSAGDQRVQLLVVRGGRWMRVRLRTTLARATARPLERPDLAGDLDRRWSGFEAALSPAALRAAGRRQRPATLQLCLYVRAHGLRRRFLRFDADALATAELTAGKGLVARAVPCPSGRIEVQVRDRWVVARGARLLDGDVLELTGALRLASAEPATTVEVRRVGDGWSSEFPMIGGGDEGSFAAGIPLSELYVAPPDAGAAEELWQLSAIEGARRVPVALRGPSPALRWWSSGRELTLARTRAGGTAIVVRDARPLIASAAWAGADRLELEVRLPPGLAERELVLMDWHRNRAYAFPLVPGDEEGAYRAVVSAAELLVVPAGLTPRRGEWRFYGRPLESPALPAMARARLAGAAAETLPLSMAIDERPFTLEPSPDGSLMLSVPARTAVPARARGGRGPARAAASAREPAG